MLLNTLSKQQMQDLQALFSRRSIRSLSHCVKGIDELEDFQTVAVAYSVITKGCLLNIDTGLGKTLIAAGIINVLRSQKPKLKWVYLCQCSNLKTTADKLSSHLFGVNLVYCDSTEAGILKTFLSMRASNADVLVLSYEAIVQPEVEGFLFRNRDIYQGIFLDESQMLSNLSSHTSRLVSAIINTACYKYLLSATPLRVSITQVVNQVYMIDRQMFAQVNMQTFLNHFRVWSDNAVVGYKNLDELQYELMPRMLSFSRSELQLRGDYTPIVKVCNCGLPEDCNIDSVISYKQQAYGNTMLELSQLVKNYAAQGKRGLIYANRNTLKQAVKASLAEAGLAVGILDGSVTTTQALKDKVHTLFLDGEYNVLITNITMGKDLPCDYIVFYELTFDYKQMVGRGERGLSGSPLDIVFILTDSAYELKYFYARVFQRGVLLEKLCGKDMPELHEAVKHVEEALNRKGVLDYGISN